MNPTNAVATVLTQASALDTNDDSLEEMDATSTQFEGEASIAGPALIELAQRAVAERDALRGEVVRLRDALTKSEANARRGQGSSTREVAELREGLELREREVRRLKDANVARERLLVDARIKLDEAMGARQAAVVRMEVRDRAASEAEAQRDVAVTDAQSWRKKFEAVDSELSRALASERALTVTNDDARLQLAEAERTIVTLRAELAETRQALCELDAIASRREIEHRAELAAIEERHRAELATIEQRTSGEREGRELALRYVASERLERERYEWEQARAAMRAELRASLDDADRLREEHALDMHAWKARNTAEREAGEAAVEGCVKGAAFRYAELARELELERAARMCEASRQGQAMNAVREANEFAVSALRARVAREQERAKRADDELAELCLVRDEAAAAIADVLATLEAKIERLEGERGLLRSMFDECDATREALAQHAVAASQRANEARAKVEELEREFERQTRQMAELVGVLTRTTVEQHAIAGALKRGRVLPTMADVDAALVAVSRRVPEHMSSVLWGARDAIASAVFAGPEAAAV
jgi:hypothetical protein